MKENEKKELVKNKEKNGQIKVSNSRIETIKNCYGKYYFQYIEKIKVVRTNYPNTIFGLVVHDILEEIIKNENKSNITILKQYKKGFFAEKFKEKNKILKEKNQQFKLSKRISRYGLSRWLSDCDKKSKLFIGFVLKYFKDVDWFESEKRIILDWEFDDELFFELVIDLLVHNKSYSIFDFKTTSYSDKFWFIDWRYDIQSLIYTYGAFFEYKNLTNLFSYLIFNHDEKSIFFNTKYFMKKDLISTKKNREKYFGNLIKILENFKLLHKNPDVKYYRPEYTKCYWCNYQKICSEKK